MKHWTKQYYYDMTKKLGHRTTKVSGLSTVLDIRQQIKWIIALENWSWDKKFVKATDGHFAQTSWKRNLTAFWFQWIFVILQSVFFVILLSSFLLIFCQFLFRNETGLWGHVMVAKNNFKLLKAPGNPGLSDNASISRN